jgi:tRNA A-37 threonylcarbamoyl transferase component Bud32
MPEQQDARPQLTRRHRLLLTSWLGDWSVLADYSWPLQDTAVLHIVSDSGEHIVKASESSHHIQREINAHRTVLSTLDEVPVPRLQFADADAGVLVTEYLPGRLLLGAPEQDHADAFEQAGRILARLQLPGSLSAEYMDDVAAQAIDLVQRAEEILDERSRRMLQERVAAVPRHPVRLHFTHGDYQPRNWLVHEGRIAVIDFGRGAQRSWVSDLVRLRSKDFHGRPELEAAFMRGMGRELDASDAAVLELETMREAIGTVVWSHGIGDRDFEQHGRAMIRRLLDGDAVSA